MYRCDVPVNTNPLTLFEFSVRKVISLGMMNVSNTHQAWANLIFNYEKKAFVYAVRRGVMLVGRSSMVLDIALDRSMEQVPRCAR